MRTLTMPTDSEFRDMLTYLVQNMQKTCKVCGSSAEVRFNKGIYLRCTLRMCRKEVAIFKNTILHRSRLDPVTTVLKILKYWMYKTTSGCIAGYVGLNKNTVSSYLKRMRTLIEGRYLDSLPVIGEPGIIVEVDESKFGKRKYNRGHGVDGVWVLGMAERTPQRRIITLIVPDRKAHTLISILKKYVHPDSCINSDCWKGYFNLKDHFFNMEELITSVLLKISLQEYTPTRLKAIGLELKRMFLIDAGQGNIFFSTLSDSFFFRNSELDLFLALLKLLF